MPSSSLGSWCLSMLVSQSSSLGGSFWPAFFQSDPSSFLDSVRHFAGRSSGKGPCLAGGPVRWLGGDGEGLGSPVSRTNLTNRGTPHSLDSLDTKSAAPSHRWWQKSSQARCHKLLCCAGNAHYISLLPFLYSVPYCSKYL